MPTKETEYEFTIDGKAYTVEEDFTFKEQREYRDLVRELAGDPTIQPMHAPGMDRWPAMITIIKRRDDPEYTLEQSLEDYKVDDVIKEKKAPPRKARSGSTGK